MCADFLSPEPSSPQFTDSEVKQQLVCYQSNNLVIHDPDPHQVSAGPLSSHMSLIL